jgi:hypothetical protein
MMQFAELTLIKKRKLPVFKCIYKTISGSQSDHILFEVKHLMRHSSLDHPLSLELNTLATPQKLKEYYLFEQNLARRFILLQEYHDFPAFFSKLSQIIKFLRLKFLAGSPSPWKEHHFEPFTPSVNLWTHLFELTEEQYEISSFLVSTDSRLKSQQVQLPHLICETCLSSTVALYFLASLQDEPVQEPSEVLRMIERHTVTAGMLPVIRSQMILPNQF